MIFNVVLPGNLLINAALQNAHLGGDSHGHADKSRQDNAYPQSSSRPVANQLAIHHEYHRSPKKRHSNCNAGLTRRHGRESVVGRTTSPNRGEENKEPSRCVCLPRPRYARIQNAAIGLRCPEKKIYEWIIGSKGRALPFKPM